MERNFYKINVIVITYKQENLIGRAIDSCLSQRNYGLNKIIICDDCSPDKTGDRIDEYAKKYPEIIEAYHNSHNLGIYGNAWEVTTKRGDADFYCTLSGDDALCDGWFKKLQEFLADKDVKPREQCICVFSDWKLVTPGNVERVFRQNLVAKKNVDALSLRVRGLICGRSMLQSNALIKQQTPVDLKHGVSKAEKFFEFQPVMHAQYHYYCPFVGSIYYSGIGISTTAHSIEYRRGIIEANKSFLETFKLKKKDESHIKYKIASEEYHIKPSFSLYFKRIWLYIKSIDINIGFSYRQLINVFLGR